MEIDTLRDFGSLQRKIDIAVSLNGKEYKGRSQTLGSNITDSKQLTFDLMNASVPRFTDNVVLTVKVTANLDNSSYAAAPVVLSTWSCSKALTRAFW